MAGKPETKPGEDEASRRKEAPHDMPPAGPHADPALTNPDATPGTGALAPPGEHGDTDSTSS